MTEKGEPLSAKSSIAPKLLTNGINFQLQITPELKDFKFKLNLNHLKQKLKMQ